MMMKPKDSILFCRASFTSAAISVLACEAINAPLLYKSRPDHSEECLHIIDNRFLYTHRKVAQGQWCLQ